MTKTCSGCRKWVLKRRRLYEDGTENVYFEAEAGKGHCEVLDAATKPEFGCYSFEQTDGDHVVTDHVVGMPWQDWTIGPCPDCGGKGSTDSVCHRCAGTGKVRFYADGYVGEERIRRHPKEPAVEIAVDPSTVLKPMDRASVV